MINYTTEEETQRRLQFCMPCEKNVLEEYPKCSEQQKNIFQ